MQSKLELKEDNTAILIVADRLSALHNDVSDMRDSFQSAIKEMSTAVSKLVVLEEKNTNLNKAVDDLRTDTKDLSKRLMDLERESPSNKQTSEWVKTVMYGLAGIVAMFIGKKTGLI